MLVPAGTFANTEEFFVGTKWTHGRREAKFPVIRFTSLNQESLICSTHTCTELHNLAPTMQTWPLIKASAVEQGQILSWTVA